MFSSRFFHVNGNGNCHSQQDVYFDITKTGEEAIIYDDSIQINIDFSGKFKFRTINLVQVEPSVTEFEIPEISNSVSFELKQFLCYDNAWTTIHLAMRTWPIIHENRVSLIEKIYSDASAIAKSMSPGNNLLLMHVNVQVVHRRIYETDIFQGVLQQSMDESNVCSMVPASDSSIKSLKRTRIDYENNCAKSCIVCLEEFSKESKTICMPCSHLFHGNCIKQWLRTSHYCPICRFEMPTS
ncbi:E3 ubiquitin-protein ligase RNF43-like [Abeliophyllum distichum]|uniref:RING-type E3 ubiquitin transferase n=1 Tax=Abeliophyllum distichum TaxID=126358 RepID=A0ABD1SUB2_9LAMI